MEKRKKIDFTIVLLIPNCLEECSLSAEFSHGVIWDPEDSGHIMDEWTKKTPNPKCRLFFKIDLLTNFAACV